MPFIFERSGFAVAPPRIRFNTSKASTRAIAGTTGGRALSTSVVCRRARCRRPHLRPLQPHHGTPNDAWAGCARRPLVQSGRDAARPCRVPNDACHARALAQQHERFAESGGYIIVPGVPGQNEKPSERERSVGTIVVEPRHTRHSSTTGATGDELDARCESGP